MRGEGETVRRGCGPLWPEKGGACAGTGWGFQDPRAVSVLTFVCVYLFGCTGS